MTGNLDFLDVDRVLDKRIIVGYSGSLPIAEFHARAEVVMFPSVLAMTMFSKLILRGLYSSTSWPSAWYLFTNNLPALTIMS